MPISFADLKRKEREIEVATVAGMLTVVYRLGEVTEAAISGGERPGFERVIEHLSAWISRWDLMDGEAMYPVTFEALRELPRALLLDVYRAINEDVAARPTKRAGSLGAG